MTIRAVLLTIAIVVAVLAGLALALALAGVVDVSAATPHSGITAWYLDLVRERSIHRRIEDIEAPELTAERAASGAAAYREMCAGCHGAPGAEPSPVGRGLNPAPPALARQHWSEPERRAEAFWVIKYGIRMTGMAAFGETHDDRAVWELVAFLTRLPSLEPESYREMSAQSGGGVGHQGHEHGQSRETGSSAGD